MACYKPDGSRMWQRNILYYLVVPERDPCTGGAASNGFDDHCPHKLLIRKVIDNAPPTVPTDETTEEALLSDVTPYLTQPSGLDTSGMSVEPGVGEVRIVALNLLGMELRRPQEAETQVDLRALSLLDAMRNLRVGSISLTESSFTQQEGFSVFPRN
jgi:hypothetical protein